MRNIILCHFRPGPCISLVDRRKNQIILAYNSPFPCKTGNSARFYLFSNPPKLFLQFLYRTLRTFRQECFQILLFQTHPADEIVIADDGSKEDTRRLIESFKDKLPIKHVWHEDNGFQKSRILNSAILASESDYLIFTDQDCIPRKDFIATHAAYAEKGYFLSGGYFKLPMDISKQLTYNDIKSENAFSLSWLKEQHMKCNFKCTKLIKNKTFTRFMNAITPTKATWNGCNASGWREDIFTVNGFNEEMHYGGQDREFGERMFNLGIKSKQIRYSAIVLHLDHKRPYKTKESIEKNINIRRNTRKTGITETPFGIKQLH